ncbi:DUF551 domain-containing protein [Clostridium sp. HBUAS56010]|uniref:DUF551 domain-containing protein n=1 Tax=Clostridium sp. HBUAS56010 TaxID=2571127 RepID=UPI0011777C2E|nr:DUF551 domain-containing protein [Clostridium sp. HBUAS56010]
MKKEFKRIIDKLNKIPTEGLVGTYGDHELVRGVIDSCIEIVEQIASECSNDWISCSKSMPEDILTYNRNTFNPVINVLVTTENGKVTKLQRIGNKGYDGEHELTWYWGRIHGGIKAWQSLPEGYKGE